MKASISNFQFPIASRGAAPPRTACHVSGLTSHASRIKHHASQFQSPAARGAESGIALVIVMISILVLAVLAGGFAYSMKVETTLARNANSETELEWLGRSGVALARTILAEQARINPQYDGLDQVWAGGPGDLQSSNSWLPQVEREVHLGRGSFTWKITDMERRFNINAPEPMLQQILPQVLMALGVDAGEQTPILNAILDWLDPDDTTHLQGAEGDYYKSLDPPYEAKNGPIDDLSELLLVRGITPEMYWGGSSTNHPPGRLEQQLNRFGAPMARPAYSVGLVELLTPLSSGRININTASTEVLQLIPGIDSLTAQAIVSGRDGQDDGSRLLGPYHSIGEVARTPEINRAMIPLLSQYCDVHSRVFEVEIEAQVDNYKRHFSAILARNNPRDVQVLNFYWK